MQSQLEHHVRQAKGGDRSALEAVVSRIQGRIYGLALRMLGRPEDAEDETQEILIKVITHLSDFREESAFSSWVYRIACNHLLTRCRQRNTRAEITFDSLEELIAAEAVAVCAPAPTGPERAVMLEEARLGCLQTVLTCLEDKCRIVVILADIFGVTSREGAYILHMTPAAFRKRLSRGRERIHRFMTRHCGLVNPENTCRCETKAAGGPGRGADPFKGLVTDGEAAARIRSRALAHLRELSEIERTMALFRHYPQYRAPESFQEIVRNLIDSGKYRYFTA